MKFVSKSSPSATSLRLFANLKQQLFALQEIALKHSINLEVFSDESNPEAFLLKPQDLQTEILKNFSSYVSFYDRADKEGVHLVDDHSVAWAALRWLDAKPCNDFFGRLKDNDIIECYNTDHIQIFRNLKFFEYVSYTVYDILVYEWDELYWRDQEMHVLGMKEMLDTLEKGKETLKFKMPIHEIHEVFSEERRKFNWIPGLRSPLFDRKDSANKKPIGLIMTCRAEQIA